MDPDAAELLDRIARNVKCRRMEMNLTVTRAAKKGGIHWRHWQKVENKESNVTLQPLRSRRSHGDSMLTRVSC